VVVVHLLVLLSDLRAEEVTLVVEVDQARRLENQVERALHGRSSVKEGVLLERIMATRQRTGRLCARQKSYC
jgi:hypothetical protein